MSLHSLFDPSLPMAFGGCTCHCHRNRGVVHVAPCCGPWRGGSMVDLLGVEVTISPDLPKMRLSEGVREFLDPEYVREVDAWLLEFFGTTNVVDDGQVVCFHDPFAGIMR